MRKNGMGRVVFALAVTTLGLGLAAGSAHALSLSPGGEFATSNDNSNCGLDCITDVTGVTGLTLLYKANVGGVDEGSLDGSYDTVFANTSTDPSDFEISYLGSGAERALCPECFLVVKDGKHSPAQYFFNIGSWNGMDDISGTGFWPNGGAISNVAIWGKATSVPEPASLLLLGTGLLGIGAWRLATRQGTRA